MKPIPEDTKPKILEIWQAEGLGLEDRITKTKALLPPATESELRESWQKHSEELKQGRDASAIDSCFNSLSTILDRQVYVKIGQGSNQSKPVFAETSAELSRLSEAPELLITQLRGKINADAAFAGKFIKAVLNTFHEVSYMRPQISRGHLQQFEGETTDTFVENAMENLRKMADSAFLKKTYKGNLPDHGRDLER